MNDSAAAHRALALKPYSRQIRLDPSIWGGQQCESRDYLTDGRILLPYENFPALGTLGYRLLESFPQDPEDVLPAASRDDCAAIWEKEMARTRVRAECVGYLDRQETLNCGYFTWEIGRIAYLANLRENRFTVVNLAYLRLVDELTAFDAIKIGKPDDAVMFCRAGRPLALLMPLRLDDGALIDLTVLRERQ